MVTKVATRWIGRVTDAELINQTTLILKSLADHAGIYSNPSPSLATIQAALDNFSIAVAQVAMGGKPATVTKNTLRTGLIGEMRQLALYVQSACGGSLTNLLLSGFPIQKPVREAIGVLPAPTQVTVNLGARTGELWVQARPVSGAAGYNWQLTSTGSGGTERVEHSTAARYIFSGLTPGVSYNLAVSAIGAAGPSDWSQPVSQMVV
jgi:hypothetical protein